MDDLNYVYEAVYLFNKIYSGKDYAIIQPDSKGMKDRGMDRSLYRAILRILVVSNLMSYDGTNYIMTKKQIDSHKEILKCIENGSEGLQYETLYHKAMNESVFFFDRISEIEYEIYSRCNFPVTYNMGKEVVKHIDFSNKDVLELGGNSGGLATIVMMMSEKCRYKIIDSKIPCMVGNEFKTQNEVDISFIEADIFQLKWSGESYDYVMMMNLLHDFNDEKCLMILKNCINYCKKDSKILIIEDILTDEFEPKEVIMHGMRLAIECKGGKQRTIHDYSILLSKVNLKMKECVKLNSIHSMLIAEVV